MPEDIEHADASVANHSDLATPASLQAPPSVPLPFEATDVGDATVAAFDDVEYTLTVGQALERITAARRKSPSGRSMQRYCIEGRLIAKKIRTIFGSEWLINEDSLARFIESEPVVASDANPEFKATLASPMQGKPFFQPADTTVASVAGDATPPSTIAPEGERRTLAGVLIENAKLLAQVEGRDAVIAELKEDRAFLREEVREGRRTRDDVKAIAERMLDTLRTMAIGRSIAVSNPSPDPMRGTIYAPERQEGAEGDNLR